MHGWQANDSERFANSELLIESGDDHCRDYLTVVSQQQQRVAETAHKVLAHAKDQSGSMHLAQRCIAFWSNKVTALENEIANDEMRLRAPRWIKGAESAEARNSIAADIPHKKHELAEARRSLDRFKRDYS